MKTAILIFLSLLSSSSFFAQQRGINLKKINSEKSLYIEEHKRIKIKTSSGKHIAGKFYVISDSVIKVKNKIIAIKDIVEIRKTSTFSSIVSTTSTTIGLLFLGGGLAGSISEKNNPSSGFVSPAAAFGILTVISLPFIIVPLTTAKHPNKKWEYEIKMP